MNPYCCSICARFADESDTCECGGKIIATEVYRASRVAEADRMDEVWAAFHAMRDEEPSYQPGFMFKRQAGGVK